ncbi:anthrone oxygenase family protein [Skermania piniformis]|uniref:anthrone oxygenase family protein n=1 Tax=Skermania pinensis TaxID=39122 RepID=UPI0031BA47F2
MISVAAVVTIAFNVPLNNALAVIDPGMLTAADAAREWQRYADSWTAWNHVRTIAPLLGSALLLVGARYPGT